MIEARARQHHRQGTTNAALSAAEVGRLAVDPGATEQLEALYRRGGLSMRGAHRVLRVARTIADLGAEDRITLTHVGRALGLRQDLSGDAADAVAA